MSSDLIVLSPNQLEEIIERVIEKALENFSILLNQSSQSLDDEIYLTREQAQNYLSIGKTRIFELKKEGKLQFIKEGGKLLFPKSKLIEYRKSITRYINK